MLALPYVMSAVTLLLAALCGVAYSGRLARRNVRLNDRVRVRDLPLIPLTLVLFVLTLAGANLVTRDAAWMWRMPVILDYYLRPLFWATKLAFLAFPMTAIAVLAFRQKHRGRYGILVFSLLVIAAVEVQMRVMHRPYLDEVTDLRTPDGIIRQSTASTCAAAACANILRQFDRDVTEADMVAALNTTWEGTSPGQMVYGLRDLGFVARKVDSVERELAEVTAPAVLLVDLGTEPDGHAVAYMGRKGEDFEIWDPGSGKTIQTHDQIKGRWGGHAIEVSLPRRGT